MEADDDDDCRPLPPNKGADGEGADITTGLTPLLTPNFSSDVISSMSWEGGDSLVCGRLRSRHKTFGFSPPLPCLLCVKCAMCGVNPLYFYV